MPPKNKRKRSTSVSSTSSEQRKTEEETNDQDEDKVEIELEDAMDPELAAMMGFKGFGTTKNKKVDDNHETAAKGAAAKNKQKRKAQQYMNKIKIGQQE